MVSWRRSDRSRSRSLLPREHGAYAELGLPLLTALLSGRPRWPAASLTLAIVAAFLAHEPVLVLLGRRGARAAVDERARAFRRILVLGAVAIGFGAVAASVAMLIPAILFGVSAALVALDRERTAPGEIVIATCLASAAIPVAVASEIPMRAAVGAWVAWSIGLYAATVAVRGVIASRKHGTPPSRTTALVSLAPLAAAALAAVKVIPWWSAAASLPLVVLAMIIAMRPPHPRSLSAIGWALVTATVATATTIVLSS